ncbi:RHS repeat-associated core domain-containing protein [Pseudomonas japonica]|uniref:RHS repeat-associated core domain-containing protein n=1 Tax=Pseudomonas japonica TaxID=256466 RepID=UPI0037FBD19A
MSNDRLALLACTLHQSPLRAVAGGHLQDIVHGPYGHRRETPGLPGSGFNGQWREPETGWYLLGNGYRAYNPVLMRFNSPDSLSPFGRGGLNAYGYCLGDPVNRTDPDGHVPLLRLFTQLRKFLGRSARRIAGSKGRPARQKMLLSERGSTSSSLALTPPAPPEDLPVDSAVSAAMTSKPDTRLTPEPVQAPVRANRLSNQAKSSKGATPREVRVFKPSQVTVLQPITPMGGSGLDPYSYLPEATRKLIRQRNQELRTDALDTNPSGTL